MRRTVLLMLFVLLTTLIISTRASAHGGVSIEQDTCVLRIGPYRMHFAGYQPETASGVEFCEDIPVVGKAIIVLDFVEPQLKDRTTEVRILERTDSWDAALNQPEGDKDAQTILHLPPQLYTTSTIRIDYTFNKAGNFVGLVTSTGGRDSIVSRFPFRVGYTGLIGSGGGGYLYGIIGVAILIAGGAFYYFKMRKKAEGVAV
jgi:hypothetical protein